MSNMDDRLKRAREQLDKDFDGIDKKLEDARKNGRLDDFGDMDKKRVEQNGQLDDFGDIDKKRADAREKLDDFGDDKKRAGVREKLDDVGHVAEGDLGGMSPQGSGPKRSGRNFRH